MSKIYEALRRAELESANRAVPPDPTLPPETASSYAPTARSALAAQPGAASNASPAFPAAHVPQAVPDPVFISPRASAPSLGETSRPPARALPERAPAAPPSSATTLPAARPPAIRDLPRIDIPEIPPSPADLADPSRPPWDPSIHQLPALIERGVAVEQFRSLRSRLQQFRDLNPIKSILVASGQPQEGKSFIAVNLAISFARHKASRVLLIDGDMRRPSLYKVLGAPEGPGLTEYLAGTCTFADILQRPRHGVDGRPLPLGLDSLSFIPGGHASDRAADLSGNRRFDSLIAEAVPRFDWIVVDSSPVNLVSDGVNFARACDGVLLVARGGATSYRSAQRALAELKASTVLGVVLNAVQKQTVATGYYGYDGYDKINV